MWCVRKALVVALVGFFSISVSAQSVPRWDMDEIESLFVDPTDVVLLFKTQSGPCGSRFYHIKRSDANFKEMYALALVARTSRTKIRVHTASCINDRNMVTHGNLEQ